ncbi:hypothetical protein [Hoeflea sp.]|uniref:hypothetical protein n=1 Tax=Hoeflea sp. TaxID=1940281 RepID=UPI0019AA1CAD|nr:hypothetical protein [Hoeflea sp.]MBC7280214.1 hypothetical protein [Hoeflea sp.]
MNLREMPRGLRACRMLDVSFLEFPADTGQSDNVKSFPEAEIISALRLHRGRPSSICVFL